MDPPACNGNRLREVLYRRVTSVLGPIPLNAAQRINQEIGKYIDDQVVVLGADLPFK